MVAIIRVCAITVAWLGTIVENVGNPLIQGVGVNLTITGPTRIIRVTRHPNIMYSHSRGDSNVKEIGRDQIMGEVKMETAMRDMQWHRGNMAAICGRQTK